MAVLVQFPLKETCFTCARDILQAGPMHSELGQVEDLLQITLLLWTRAASRHSTSAVERLAHES